MPEDLISRTQAAAARGIVYACRFDGEGRPETLDRIDDIAPLVRQPGFVWLHFNLADHRGCDLIDSLDWLPEDVRELMLDRAEHQQVVAADGVVAAVLDDHVMDFDHASAESHAAFRFALGPHFLISGRRRPVQAADKTRRALLAGESFETPVALVEEIVDRIAESISRAADALIVDANSIEDQLLEGRIGGGHRRRLMPLRRSAVRLHRQITGLMGVLRRIEHMPPRHVPEELKSAAARLHQRLDGLNQDLLSIRERARLLQDEILAKLSSEANDHLYVLTIVTAFLVPPTLISGMFGMNLNGLPFSEWENGFVPALLLMLLSVGFVWLALRRGRGPFDR